MVRFQRVAGLAALFNAAAFVFGFWVYFTLLGPARYGARDVEPAQHAAFLVANGDLLTVWNLVIYVGFGIALVVLSIGLWRRLAAGAPDVMALASAFGLIWAGLVIAAGMVANIGIGVIADLHRSDPAAAGALWNSYRIMVAGIGGGNEIVGGLWLALIGIAAVRARGMARWIGYAALAIGVSGMLTTIPALGELGSVFGLGLIVWFALVGLWLIFAPGVDAGRGVGDDTPSQAPLAT